MSRHMLCLKIKSYELRKPQGSEMRVGEAGRIEIRGGDWTSQTPFETNRQVGYGIKKTKKASNKVPLLPEDREEVALYGTHDLA